MKLVVHRFKQRKGSDSYNRGRLDAVLPEEDSISSRAVIECPAQDRQKEETGNSFSSRKA